MENNGKDAAGGDDLEETIKDQNVADQNAADMRKEKEDMDETEKAANSVIKSDTSSDVVECQSISSTNTSEVSTPKDTAADGTQTAQVESSQAITCTPVTAEALPAVDIEQNEVKPDFDYRCLPPYAPAHIVPEEQDNYPENLPPGLEKPYGVDVIEGKWVATCNRSRVGDIHGEKRDVDRFGPCPLLGIFKDKDIRKKIYSIPWWSDPGVFDTEIDPIWSETLDQYLYRVLWKSKSDYDFVWYPEQNLIWAAPKGKFDEELKIGAKSRSSLRQSDRILQDLLPNGHRLSICQRMGKDDIVLYGTQKYRIFENRTTDYGLYCILCDDYGKNQIHEGVQLTENDCTFLYYTSLDRPNLELAKSHKTVQWQKEKVRDKGKGGRCRQIVNPFQKLIDAEKTMDIVQSIASGAANDGQFVFPSPPKRKRRRRKSEETGDTTQSDITTPNYSERLDMDLSVRPSYEDLEAEVNRCHKLLIENGIDTEVYKTAAELCQQNAIETSKVLASERFKMEQASNTLVLTAQQLNSNMERSNLLQEQYQELARKNLMYLFATVQNRLFGLPPTDAALNVPYARPGTPDRPIYPSSILGDALGSAEKERQAMESNRPTPGNDSVRANLDMTNSAFIPIHASGFPPSTIRTIGGQDIVMHPESMVAVNSQPVLALPVTGVIDVDALAKRNSDCLKTAANDVEIVKDAESKISQLQTTENDSLAKKKRLDEQQAQIMAKKQLQFASVSKKRLSDSPKPSTSTPGTPTPGPSQMQEDDESSDVKLLSKSFIESNLPETVEELPNWDYELFAYGLNEFSMAVRNRWLKPSDKDYWKINIAEEISKFPNRGGPDWGQKEPMLNEVEEIDCNTRSNVHKFLPPLLIKTCRQIELLNGLRWTSGKTKHHRNSDTHVRNALKYLFSKMWQTNRPPEIATFDQALNLGIPFRPKISMKSISALVRECKVNMVNANKLHEDVAGKDAMMSAELQALPNYLPPKQYSPFEFTNPQRIKLKKDVENFKKNRTEFDKSIAKVKKLPSKRKIKSEIPTDDTAESVAKKAKLELKNKSEEVIDLEDSPKQPASKGKPQKANPRQTVQVAKPAARAPVTPKPIVTKPTAPKPTAPKPTAPNPTAAKPTAAKPIVVKSIPKRKTTKHEDTEPSAKTKPLPKDTIMNMDLEELRAYSLAQTAKLIPPEVLVSQYKEENKVKKAKKSKIGSSKLAIEIEPKVEEEEQQEMDGEQDDKDEDGMGIQVETEQMGEDEDNEHEESDNQQVDEEEEQEEQTENGDTSYVDDEDESDEGGSESEPEPV